MLSPWKKSYDQPRQHIKKERHYFASKVHLVKATVFPVVMHGYERWPIKAAECQRIDAFELWCWEKTLESHLDCKEIHHGIYLEGMLLKLKLQYFGHLM